LRPLFFGRFAIGRSDFDPRCSTKQMITNMTAEEIRAHWAEKFHRAADDLRAFSTR
jgi:hypothetical protein